MRRFVIGAILFAGIAAATSAAQAASFSSSRLFSQIKSAEVAVATNKFNLTTHQSVGTVYPDAAKVQVGLEAGTLVVDTVSDDGTISALDVRPYALMSSPISDSFSAMTQIFDPSVSFPDPPVLINVSGTWHETITFTGLVGGAPTFLSASTGALMPESPQAYFMTMDVAYSNLAFTLLGEYKVQGPLTTLTIPFSLEFEPVPNASYAQAFVSASPSFGNGFGWGFNAAGVGYTLADPILFQGVVDGISFDVRTNSSLQVTFAQIPEPGALALAVGFLTLTPRRRGTASRV